MGIVDNSMIKIEIDGIEFRAKRGSKIIDVADEVGVYIPRFCYHKKLSLAANCRMCLVEVEKAPKLFPACTTLIVDGMKIFTNTERVVDAQQAVMEFLLINHPLDCPVCDQGGECELQDLAIGYGCSSSRFVEGKRSFEDYDFGPLVSTDITRCILCSRCVRFCEEIAGTGELGIINRGSNSRIFTFLKNHLRSELSGNVIDLCPVGALTAKPSKFKFRSWELVQNAFVSCHDCVGSNLYVHVFNDKVVRVVPKRHDSLNEVWISDRDRFSYEGLLSDDKLKFPMVKKDGIWENVSWDEAFNYSFDKISDIKSKFGARQLGGLASVNSTVEELFLLQKFLRVLGSNNLDHRLKQTDFSNQDDFPIFTGLDIGVDQIDKIKNKIIIGSNIVKEQSIIGLKLRQVIKNGGNVFVLNPADFDFAMDLTGKYIVNPKNFLNVLMSIIKTLSSKSDQPIDFFGMDELFKSVKSSNLYFDLVNAFLTSTKNLVVLGSYVSCSPDYTKLVSISSLFAKITKSNYGILTDGANSSGAWITGFVPHRLPGGKKNSNDVGLNAFDMFSKQLKAYILFGLEIEYDSFYSNIAIQALKNSEFVLSFASFKSDVLLDVSNVILPIASSYENSGTFVNVSGIWQSFTSVIPCSYKIKCGWQAINAMANYFKLSGFSHTNVVSILNEFKPLVDLNKSLSWSVLKVSDLSSRVNNDIIMVPSILLYDNDSLVRRAKSLQKVNKRECYILKCNKSTYNNLKLEGNYLFFTKNGKQKKYLVFVDDSISDDSIFVESGNDYRDFNLPYKSIFVDKI